MNCTRGHDKSFLVGYAEIKKRGDGLKVVKRCSYILGTTGNNRAVICGEYPRDEDLPKDLLKIDGLKL